MNNKKDFFISNLLSIIFYIDIGSFFEEKILFRKFAKAHEIYKLQTKNI